MIRADRRIRRTKKALRDALIEKMIERNWDEISIQLICDQADVARSTFYTHFNNKQELLDFGFSQLIEELDMSGKEATGGGDHLLKFLPALIEHIHDHGKLFDRLMIDVNGIIIMNKFKSIINEKTRAELRSLKPDISDFKTSFIAGGIFGIIENWHAQHFRTPKKQVLNEMDKLVRQMAY